MNRLVLAHTLGAGGPEIELLLIGAALMWLALLFYFRKAVKPVVSVVLVVLALVLGTASFLINRSPSGAGLNVNIVEPDDGAEVRANKPLQLDVKLTGGKIVTTTQSSDPRAGHLHVYVDSELVDMPTTSQPKVRLKPGSHTVTVEFVDAQHRAFSPPIQDAIQVQAG